MVFVLESGDELETERKERKKASTLRYRLPSMTALGSHLVADSVSPLYFDGGPSAADRMSWPY